MRSYCPASRYAPPQDDRRPRSRSWFRLPCPDDRTSPVTATPSQRNHLDATVAACDPSDAHEERTSGRRRGGGAGAAGRGVRVEPGPAAGHGPRHGSQGTPRGPASLRGGGHGTGPRRARRVLPQRPAGQSGPVAVEPGQRARHGLSRRPGRHRPGHGRRAAPAGGERPGAGGGPAGPFGRAARRGRPGRDAGRQRPGSGRPQSPDRTHLPERRRHRVWRRPGQGAAAEGPRSGEAGDQPGDRDRHQGPDPAFAAPRRPERRHRLGADRRALPARRVGHPVRSGRDRARAVHHRRGPGGHGAVHAGRPVPCGQRGRLDRGLARVSWRQAGDGGTAAARRLGRPAPGPPRRPSAP